VTNEFLETTVPDVWAAGDVAEFYDVVSQRHHRMGTWDNSLNHGRHVAKNMLGAREPYVEVPTYASSMFNSNISVMGVTSEEEPDAEDLVEVEDGPRNYKRLFFLDDRLVGAILIGKMKGARAHQIARDDRAARGGAGAARHARNSCEGSGARGVGDARRTEKKGRPVRAALRVSLERAQPGR